MPIWINSFCVGDDMKRSELPPAIFLMGPTASGKTALAVQLACALDAEIISVDSALVFRGMDIGTAKPDLDERGGIAHHLIDILDPTQAFSTGEFRSKALALMGDIAGRGKLPLLAGGTMLYFNALLRVWPNCRRRIRIFAGNLIWNWRATAKRRCTSDCRRLILPQPHAFILTIRKEFNARLKFSQSVVNRLAVFLLKPDSGYHIVSSSW